MPSVLLDLVLPAGCAGCGAGARTGLCHDCLSSLAQPVPHAPDPPPLGFPATWVAGRYEHAVRAAIVAYKERGRRDVGRPLGVALARATLQLGAARAGARLLLVPVPSRSHVARMRGGDHVRRLAIHAAAWIRTAGVAVDVAPLLRLATRPRDAAGLSVEERAVNLRGAFTTTSAIQVPARTALILVDDLITTGQTLAEAARALEVAAAPPAGGAAVAATPRQRPPWRGS